MVTYTNRVLKSTKYMSSPKYEGLHFEVLQRGIKQITYYYNKEGLIHNAQGPAIVIREKGKVVETRYVFENKPYDELIDSLITQQVINLVSDDDGDIVFDAADMFTITVALNSGK